MMGKNYGEINFPLGSTVDQAVEVLLSFKSKRKLVCGKFNGITLYSDSVTVDSAYRDITGKSKSEFEEHIS